MPGMGKSYLERSLEWGARDAERRSRQRGRRERQERERQDRINGYQQASSRPATELEAGNTYIAGHPAYYEDGGQSGIVGQRDLYYGPQGPFGPGHTHEVSHDQGQTWRRGTHN